MHNDTTRLLGLTGLAVVRVDDAPNDTPVVHGSIYRGIVQFYLPAGNVQRLHRLDWVMKTSMLKTLAAKHRSTVSKMATKRKAKTTTPHGLRRCFEARVDRKNRPALIARFGGIPLERQKWAVTSDR